jgi:hypothetical protein
MAGIDRLEGHLWATLSAMITIGKVHTWDTGSACFEPPIEERSGGGSPVSQISPEGDRSRIALLNPTAHLPQTIGCCNLLHGSADSHQRLLDEGTRAILCSKRILNLTLSKAQIHTCPLVLTVPLITTH